MIETQSSGCKTCCHNLQFEEIISKIYLEPRYVTKLGLWESYMLWADVSIHI